MNGLNCLKCLIQFGRKVKAEMNLGFLRCKIKQVEPVFKKIIYY